MLLLRKSLLLRLTCNLLDRDNMQALLSEVEIKGSKLVFEIGESKAKRARDNYSSSGGGGQQSTAPTVSVPWRHVISYCY
jgi:hypothetical protein